MVPPDLERELQELHGRSFAWSLACCAGDHHEAEETLQAAYLAVLSGRARFAHRSTLKTWFFAVIRRTAASRRRRRRARHLLLDRWLPDPADNPADERGEARLERAEQSARLRRCLTGLSQRQRQVLELVFYHQLTVADAAGVMGISVGSARTHYARGKRRLARALEEASR